MGRGATRQVTPGYELWRQRRWTNAPEYWPRGGVKIVSPPSDLPWGHRTLYFRDPDGNMLEIYAEI